MLFPRKVCFYIHMEIVPREAAEREFDMRSLRITWLHPSVVYWGRVKNKWWEFTVIDQSPFPSRMRLYQGTIQEIRDAYSESLTSRFLCSRFTLDPVHISCCNNKRGNPKKDMILVTAAVVRRASTLWKCQLAEYVLDFLCWINILQIIYHVAWCIYGDFM